MGLDSYIEPAPKTVNRPLNLCGGLFSGDGNEHNGVASFRGKVYGDTVFLVTGLSLYQDPVPGDDLEKMADRLNQALKDLPDQESWKGSDLIKLDRNWRGEFDGYYDFDVSRQEIEDLAELLTAAAEEGCTLSGWW